LAEYIICDRRRLARAPYPTNLTLEQLSLLPAQGIAAARAVRTHLVRNSRALIMGAHEGVCALVCQEMSRAGVHVTAVIHGGEDAYAAQSACMANGARGVLTGSPAAVMLGLDEGGWDFVLDTQGGQRIYDAAKRLLKPGAT
jgi:NADPH:quinone reductase-like Zn-dependent oxidoreductase